MAKRRSQAEIQKEILQALRDGELSIKAVSKAIDVEWAVAKNNLEHLETIGVIERVRLKSKHEKAPILFKLKS